MIADNENVIKKADPGAIKRKNSFFIVESGGKQITFIQNREFLVDKIIDVGNTVDLKMVYDGHNSVNTMITCEVLDKEVKGDKVIIYKTRRRKGYERKNGFRSRLTRLIWRGI